ncbi:MAG: dUTP diphosphatase [bacterium]|nr:dUTP diphosphatase [bacterium]
MLDYDKSIYDTNLIVELRHPQAQLPHKANISDACFDLYLPEDAVWAPRETRAVDLGLAIQLEEGWEAQIRGRSGLAKRGFFVHPGTIDHLYRKNLWLIAHNLTDEPFVFKAGDRIAQVKISRVWHVRLCPGFVDSSERGGLGSTGR